VQRRAGFIVDGGDAMKARTAWLEAAARGLAAGLVGTACMTAWQELVARLERRPLSGSARRESGGRDPWEDAPAPAQVLKRIVGGVAHVEVGPDRIPLFTNLMHWGYGTALGAIYGLVQETFDPRPLLHGPAFGIVVWAQSYATLVPLGLYEPPWHYSAKTIAKDISYHLVYGAGVAAGYELVSDLARP
jgi:hypothetical protein